MQKPDIPVSADVLPQHLHVCVRHQQPWMGPLRRYAPFGHTAGLTRHSALTSAMRISCEKQHNKNKEYSFHNDVYKCINYFGLLREFSIFAKYVCAHIKKDNDFDYDKED